MRCSLASVGEVTLSPTAAFSIDAGGGVRYDPGPGWQTFSHFEHSASSSIGDTTFSARISARCELHPRFALEFLTVLSVYAEAGPYAQARLRTGPPQVLVDIGFDGLVGVSAEVLDFELFDESYDIFDLSWNVLNFLPPRCGDGYRAPNEECDYRVANTCLADCTCYRGPNPSAPRPPATDWSDAWQVGFNGTSNGCDQACGNGVVDTALGEVCDIGHYSNNRCEGCYRCMVIGNRCGDGVVECGETCDDGNTNNCDDCPNDCGWIDYRCGNRRTDFACGESCDDGNTNALDGCDACRAYTVTCGDGFRTSDEACDDGNANDCDGCHNDCTVNENRCGDRHLCGTEECDHGGVDFQYCDPDCTFARCGDGTFNPVAIEECDETSATCDGDCSLTTCGDGTVNPLSEECDDQGRDSWSCNGATAGASACHRARCGDGYVNAAIGETCDDGDRDDCTPACNASCTGSVPAAVCGNGHLDCGEVCDDASENGLCGRCSSDCRTRATGVCGNGVREAACGELCDDGAANGTCGSCSNDCGHTLGVCGDSQVDMTCGEVCDDGNTTMCGTCNGTCRAVSPTCGNGTIDASCGEVCDTAPSGSGYDVGCNAGRPHCSSCGVCSADVCGDGVVGPSEVCEPVGRCEITNAVCDGRRLCTTAFDACVLTHGPGTCNETCTGHD